MTTLILLFRVAECQISDGAIINVVDVRRTAKQQGTKDEAKQQGGCDEGSGAAGDVAGGNVDDKPVGG